MAAEPKTMIPSYVLLKQLRRAVLHKYEAGPPLAWVPGYANLMFRPSPALNLGDPRIREAFTLTALDRRGRHFNIQNLGAHALTGSPTVSVSSSNFIRWVGTEYLNVLQFCEAVAQVIENSGV